MARPGRRRVGARTIVLARRPGTRGSRRGRRPAPNHHRGRGTLRRLGHRVRRGRHAQNATLGGLTTPETGIARLIAQNLSNGEIAEQLVLSVNTVETRVRNIPAKQGIASRVELAVLIEQG